MTTGSRVVRVILLCLGVLFVAHGVVDTNGWLILLGGLCLGAQTR